MSSSQSKITSAKCPKCKQGFEFKRVPKMEAVVCPHCGAKIRLARKKSQSGSPKQPRNDSQTKADKPPEADQTQTKPPRLPVPELSTHKPKAADSIENESQAEEFPDLNTPRKRQRVNLNELQIGASSEPEVPELEEAQGFPEIRTRRKKNRLDFDQLDDIEPESASLADLEPTRRPPTSLVDPENGDASGEIPTDADDLLPPKFLVPDIESDVNAVILPTAGGGLQVVDKTEVRVMHEGRSVKLVSLSPAELKRVRLIENLVALLIAAIMLAVAVWLVL